MTSVAPTAKLRLKVPSRMAGPGPVTRLPVLKLTLVGWWGRPRALKAPGAGVPRKAKPPEDWIVPAVLRTMAPPDGGGATAAKLIGTASVTTMPCTIVAEARPLSVVASATDVPSTSARAPAARAGERLGALANMILS